MGHAPSLRAFSRDRGLPGRRLPEGGIGLNGGAALTADRTYALRDFADRPLRIRRIGFVLHAAFGTNPGLEVAVRDGACQAKLGSSGQSTTYTDAAGAAAALNVGTGLRFLELVDPVDVEPGEAFHVSLSTPTAGGISVYSQQPTSSGAMPQALGQEIGLLEYFVHAAGLGAGGPSPDTLAVSNTLIAPFLIYRET